MVLVPFDLPPRLLEIIERLPDRGFAARMDRVYGAAAKAIARLSDVDLVKYEADAPASESQDLSLWETMAPVIGATVVDVNALINVIREQFPATGPTPRGPAGQASSRLQAGVRQLSSHVTELGERMRDPRVVSDRWNLLSELQRARTRFREEIGDLVYHSAAAFEDVRRKDVVPGYADEVAAAVLVRTTVADLVRMVEGRLEKFHEAVPEDIQWHAQRCEREMDLFGRTPAYQALRAQDKRAVIEFRQQMARLAADAKVRKADLLALSQPFQAVVLGMAEASRHNAILAEHDREVLAAIGVRIEQAEQALAKDEPAAARTLAEAALKAQALYGLDASFDAFLRALRKSSLATLTGADLRQAFEALQALLPRLMS